VGDGYQGGAGRKENAKVKLESVAAFRRGTPGKRVLEKETQILIKRRGEGHHQLLLSRWGGEFPLGTNGEYDGTEKKDLTHKKRKGLPRERKVGSRRKAEKKGLED